MNPVLLLTLTGTTKKQVILVVTVLLVIVSLPIMAVFSLGTSALSYLSNTLGGSDSTNAISTTTQGLYEGPEVAGDAYEWGNCTYWAFALRLKSGDAIPTTWGNANTWALRAILDNYKVDNSPEPNAVMQTSAGNLGHVAYVTDVNPATGAWTISEMNVLGLDIVDVKTYPASAAQNFSFIHDKVPKAVI